MLNGTARAQPTQLVSALNSSSTLLSGDAVFTGTAEDVSAWSMITVFVHSDVASATKGLSLEISSDGTNWDRKKTVTATANASQTAFGGVHSLAVVSRYFRVVYTNGSGGQSAFRLQTIYHRHKSKHLTSSLDQDINDQNDVELVRAALMGKLGSGSFGSVEVDNQKRLRVDFARTAFQEATIAEVSPVAQIDATYGLLASDHVSASGTGGSAAVSSRLFTVACGTSANGYGQIYSKRAIRYRPGQGAVGRFTALFDASAVASSTQYAGLFTAEDGVYFGYNGTAFGVNRRVGGAREIQTLTVTGADGTGGAATVTLAGATFNPTLTGGGNVQQDAREIAAGTYTGWTARQINDTVVFIADAVGNKTGSFTYAGPVDGTGSFAETRAGAATSDNWVAQTAWNVDNLDGDGDAANPSGFTLDPTKLNVYQIQYQWLGAGPITYWVEGAQSEWLLVHRIEYNNTATTATLGEPSMRVGWASESLGSSGTSLTVKGASAFGGVEGKRLPRRNPRSASNTKASIGTSYVPVLSIRVGTTFAGFTNHKEVLPSDLSVSVDGSRVSTAALYLNPTSLTASNWQYQESGESCVEVDTSATGLSGGSELGLLSLGKVGDGVIHLDDFGVVLEAGDVLTVAVKTAGSTTEATASVVWTED